MSHASLEDVPSQMNARYRGMECGVTCPSLFFRALHLVGVGERQDAGPARPLQCLWRSHDKLSFYRPNFPAAALRSALAGTRGQVVQVVLLPLLLPPLVAKTTLFWRKTKRECQVPNPHSPTLLKNRLSSATWRGVAWLGMVIEMS